MLDLAVIGGGAAGFFAAINVKIKNPGLKVAIYEKSKTVLGKVKISGGGRCNLSHASFDPALLCASYPRGSRELLSVFRRFGPADTVRWFENHGVPVKREADGRMFPVSDDSQSVIDCFMNLCRSHSIGVFTQHSVTDIQHAEHFILKINNKDVGAKNILVSPGSSEFFWNLLKEKGHHIIPPVPSLFTFNISHLLIADLQGLSVQMASLRLIIDSETVKKQRLKQSDLMQQGPLLITHWGLSGPAVLKLSAIAARVLNELNYDFEIELSLSNLNTEKTFDFLLKFKDENRKKQVVNTPLFGIPQRWWQRIHSLSFEQTFNTWSDLSKKDLQTLALNLSAFRLKVDGKSTFKEEFVTAGGVDLKEIDFRTMESKLIPGMYLAGEVLNIDAITGGFNFQAAWSEAWVISETLKSR